MSRKKGLFLCEKSDYVKSQVRLINRTLNLTNRSEQIFLIRLPRLDRVILQNTRPLNPSIEGKSAVFSSFWRFHDLLRNANQKIYHDQNYGSIKH